MPVVVIALALVIALIVVAAFVGAAINLLWWLLTGLVIGAIARLLLPGRQALGLIATALFGAAGGLIGGLLGSEVLNFGDLGQFILAIVAAMALIGIFAGTWRGEERTRV